MRHLRHIVLAGSSLTSRPSATMTRVDDGRVRDTLRKLIADRPSWSRSPDLGQSARGAVPSQPAPSFGALLKRQP
jgi:hypothetical protein